MNENEKQVLLIEYRKPSDLIPYVNNAKIHSDMQIQGIAGSIKEFGMNQPIAVADNTVLAGHGRLRAVQLLGMDSVPVVDLSYLSKAQRKAYILADNRWNEKGVEWDFNLVSLELEALQELDFDIELTGFDDEFIFSDDEGKEEDAAPALEEYAISKSGDIWALGKHRVMCGDSMNEGHVEALLEGEKAGMVFTDPPYGVGYKSNSRAKKFEVLKNDDNFLEIAPIIDLFSEGWCFVWTSWKVQNKWIDIFNGFGYPTNMIVWSKGGGGLGDLKKTFSSDYETALVWNRGCELTGKRIGSVWSVGKDATSSYVHPTQKPVELAVEAIDKTTSENTKVLDLFGGSGSTLIACEKTGRLSRTMELDEKYVDVIIKRWQEWTEKDAILISSGKIFNELDMEKIKKHRLDKTNA